jgi:NAD(P)-dependent dehydrogenase (short-subunit alcohol dehydrogenase family)
MGTFAVTGSASGMGNAVVQRLQEQGHRVIGVDIKAADVVADLSTPAGRRGAGADVLAACAGRLDGAVLAAGLGAAALFLTVGAARAAELLGRSGTRAALEDFD